MASEILGLNFSGGKPRLKRIIGRMTPGPPKPYGKCITAEKIGGVISLSLFLLPFSKTLSEAGLILALVLWIFSKIQKKETLFPLDAVSVAYFLFLTTVLLSLTQVSQGLWGSPQTLRGVWKWFKYLAIFWMCRDIFKEPKTVKPLVMVFLISMACVTVNGLVQMWQGTDWIKHYSVDIPGRFVRMRSAFGSPNDLACFYLLALPLIFQAWLEEKKWSWRSALLAGGMGIFFTAFILTLSRSAFLAVLGAVFLYLVLVGNKKIIGLFLLATALFLWPQGLIRENFVTSLKPQDITVGERLQTWRQGWELIKEKPILGHGPNTYFKEFAAHAPTNEEYRGYAHNFLIQIWSDLGVVGLALFLFPLFYGLSKKSSWKAKETARSLSVMAALWIGLVAFLIQGLWDTNFFAFQTTHLFWVFWGVFNAPATGSRGQVLT